MKFFQSFVWGNNMEKELDCVVIGAGHAGCEAALALARLNKKVLLTCLNLDSVSYLACNPSIGGTAKGHLVCEIDALGGEMGINADETAIQIRMLNEGKGPAVHSLRAQVDKISYHNRMKRMLEENRNIYLKQAEVVEILVKNNKVIGVKTALGEIFKCKTIVVATGVYLKSKIIIGEYSQNIGPNGFASANQLTQSLVNLGFKIRRFKTGTPARINGCTVDFSKLNCQEGKDGIGFSPLSKNKNKNIAFCFETATNTKTHEIILKNLSRAPMYSGIIKGVGPRYCPSIEDKIVRFPNRERHQIFLEPESLQTNEIYIQGVSTSLPADVQKELYATIKGLENAQIMRNAYAIEYDCIDSLQLNSSLESKTISGLFFAGQINGTSGYEEAAAQGLMAGINASLKIDNKSPFILRRDEAYIGVLIDDLVTKGTNEPYRMMTSRAEFRLILRQDNADFRLTETGRNLGLVSDERYLLFNNKKEKYKEMKRKLEKILKIDKKLISFLKQNNEPIPKNSIKIIDLLKRNNVDIYKINNEYKIFNTDEEGLLETLNTEIKYEGYIKQQNDEIEKLKKQENVSLEEISDYGEIKGLRIEAIQKLNTIKPKTLGQASRISGVSPADITVISIYLRAKK